MRIGFVTQLLWTRYGPFWLKLVAEAGAESRLPDPVRVRELLPDSRVAEVPALAFRLAVAQALSLQEADLLIVPDLALGHESNRGAGQDPWVASLADTLRTTVGGLPRILAVPAELSAGVEARAIELLRLITHEGRIRRIWDRHRAALGVTRYPEQPGSTRSGRQKVAVLAQPWLLGEPLILALQLGGSPVLAQHHLDPERLRREGARLESGLLPTDLEVLGAVRLLSRRGDVERLLLVADQSGADEWLLRAAQRGSHKPVRRQLLGDLPDGGLEVLLALGTL